MIVNRTRLRSLTFIILVVCTLYFMIAISLLASAKVHELIAYQLIESKQVVSSSVLPVPFGQAIAKWFLLRKDKDEVSKIFLYDIFLLPKELSLEGDIQGYSVDSNAAEKSFFIASPTVLLELSKKALTVFFPILPNKSSKTAIACVLPIPFNPC